MKNGEFLKPDKFKITIMIALLALYILVSIFFALSSPLGGIDMQNPLLYVVVYLGAPGMIVTFSLSNTNIYLGFIGILVNLFYWYILSCIVVFFIRKFGREKAPSPK